MRHTLFTATGCLRCKIAKRFMDERKIDYAEVDIKGEGMHAFREFYGQNRKSVYRGKEGIEFPVYTDGTAIRQGVGVVIAYLQAGAKLDGFIGRSQLSKGWIDGLHISDGDLAMATEFVAVLSILKKSGLKLQLDTNGKNASVLDQLQAQGIGDRIVMDVKGPLALYRNLFGEEVDQIEITKSIALVTKFPEYEFQTTVAPIIRSKGETPEIRYLTPEEIGETAKLIKDASGSQKHPYQLRLFDPGTCMDDRLKSIEELPYNAMFRYRTAAREHQVLAEIEKGWLQRGFFRLAFGKDLNDPSLYDLIVNCEKLGYESAARLIIEAANAEEIHACSLTALEAMERLSLVKKVQAALLKDNLDDNLLTVDVSDMGVVELSGLTHSQELLDRIIEVVHKVPGVSKVHSEIVIGTSLYAGDLNRPRS